jgi:hypothetical protein
MSPAAEEVRFIGVPIQEFLAVTGKQVESGKYSDGTTIKPHVREALGHFQKALAEPKLAISSYVFVFSGHIFIVINF